MIFGLCMDFGKPFRVLCLKRWVYLTKELLTHGSVAVTERYVNPNQQRLHEASENVFSEMVRGED